MKREITKIKEYNFYTKWKIIKYFFNTFPFYSYFLLISLFFVGFLEAIGILGLLPLIEIILKENEVSLVAEYFIYIFELLNLETDVITILLFIVFIFILKALIQTFVMYMVSDITSKVVHNFRSDFLKNLIFAKWNFFISKPNGRFVNTMLIECNKAATCIIAICRVLESFLRVIMLIFAASVVNLEVLILSIVAGLVLSVAITRFLKISQNTSKRTVDLHNDLSVSLSEILQNIKSLKVMNLQERLINFLNQKSYTLYKSYALQTFVKNCINIVREPIIVLFIVGGVLFLIENNVKFSETMIIVAIFYRIVNSWGIWQSNLQTLIVNETYFWSFKNILEEVKKEREIYKGKKSFNFEKKIIFENVTFGYKNNTVLEKLNLIIYKNKINLIVGPSGVGKTSIVDLLTGLHSPNSGSIMIDNVKLEEIDLRKWRNSIGYVGQENFLFNDTLRNNLTSGMDDIKDGKIWEILKIVEGYDFVKKLDNKLETIVGERGLKLSGGQRQRIFIARALLRKPEILILDEATVGLEENIEEIICKNLKSICSHTTIIAITHQKALLRHADKLFKMKKHIYGA